ncbi:MAG TPA: SpoIIE family protein phosphatase [Candidatus Angelobacter sp.]|nr:SpoIIE family protein phosphatase [Candidatus Angelobacter sp.]
MATSVFVRPKEAAILIDSAGQRGRVVISKSPFTVGRSEECDVSIPDVRVSRVHARFVMQDEVYFIEDAGSRHGTFVNGARCERTQLKNNDEIRLGAAAKMVFLYGDAPGSAADMLLTRLASSADTSDLEKLHLFLEAARNLSSSLVVDDVLRNMLGYALKITKAERGFVYLKDKSGEPALACGLDSNNMPLSRDANVTHSVVREAMISAQELITGDASRQSALAARESILFNELRTVVAIPLRTRRGASGAMVVEEADGVIYLDSRSVSRSISGVSHEVLRALASECAAVLESAKLVAAEQAAQQYRKEMEIAASIQRSLISMSGAECDFARIFGESIPCREVGGDFFDVDVSQDTVTVIVADVSGKGISAALLASVIHGMFHSQITGGASLVNAVTSINRFLCSRVAGQKYATLLAAQLRRDGSLQIVNCGHVPALIAHNGAVQQVTDGDMPVGLVAGVGFHVIEQQLPVGSRLCILTDGITETEDPSGAEFGTKNVEQCLFEPEPIFSLINKVRAFSHNQEAQDDRTIVLLERTH